MKKLILVLLLVLVTANAYGWDSCWRTRPRCLSECERRILLNQLCPPDPCIRPEPVYIDPVIPGTSSIRDYSRGGYMIEDDHVYPTLPGSHSRDYRRPGYIIERPEPDHPCLFEPGLPLDCLPQRLGPSDGCLDLDRW